MGLGGGGGVKGPFFFSGGGGKGKEGRGVDAFVGGERVEMSCQVFRNVDARPASREKLFRLRAPAT